MFSLTTKLAGIGAAILLGIILVFRWENARLRHQIDEARAAGIHTADRIIEENLAEKLKNIKEKRDENHTVSIDANGSFVDDWMW